MSGGTTCWIYGGGEKGNVTGTSKLTISNTAAITENIFGGSDSGTCGNTEVNVSGGTFAYGIYGGCFTGQVTGFSKVIVTGGNFSGTIYGGVGKAIAGMRISAKSEKRKYMCLG